MKSSTRRHFLRGAGVALALPWLESLEPRRARGQTATPRRRFVPIYFPLGTAYPNEIDYWTPKGIGAGTAWQLSPMLEPFAPIKSQVAVLAQVDQTAFKETVVDFGNGLLTDAFLTCTDPRSQVTMSLPEPNGISIDQRIASALGERSLQVGLSTLNSSCDGEPCDYSRSISWAGPGAPLGKLVDPQSVFDKIVSSGPPLAPAASAATKRKSVLDFVVGNVTSLEGRLGRTDRTRMDQFLTSVRDLETRVAALALPPDCRAIPRPTLSASVGNVPASYNRDDHANVMIDLTVMALSCDAAGVVSFMLDDARSDFPYNFLQRRHFTDAGSTPGTTAVTFSPLIASANNDGGDGTDQWATIHWWYASKVSQLCQKLAAVPDGGGASLLDNSIVWFGSGQQGEGFATNLPLLYVGSGGGILRTDRAFAFSPNQSLANVYLTFLRSVFGLPDPTFGDSTGTIPELLA
ncbi:MAG TPA: DUF1552 domain-containing protein [Polyangia bacterium]|nr:DUF1552 domain-containing protein [Polyangia bacterium]